MRAVWNSKRTIMTNTELKTEEKKSAPSAGSEAKAASGKSSPSKTEGKSDSERGGRGGGRQGGGRGRGQRRGRRPGRFEEKEFEQRILSLDRVTRVTKGGKRMRFRAAVIIGDAKTKRVGYGVSKATDVANAVNKAVIQAKKKVFTVPLHDETILHEVRQKYGAARILIKPAPKGTGIKAGGAVRVVLELAGVPNVTAKILGGKNKLNNAKATIAALKKLVRSSAVVSKSEKPASDESEKKNAKDEAGKAKA